MASGDNVFNVDTQVVAVGLSSYVGVTAGIGVVSMSMLYVSGGTLTMLGASAIGASLTALTYSASNINTFGYNLLSTSPPLTIYGPASFYLASVGATTTVNILRARAASIPG